MTGRSRFRLQDLADSFYFLEGYSLAGLSQLARRLHLHLKRGRLAVHSPDPAYGRKLLQLERALIAAVETPAQVRVMFGDEASIYRQPSLGQAWERSGYQPVVRQVAGSNHRWRLAGALDAVSGKVVWLARSSMRIASLKAYLRLLRQAYPDPQQRLVLVWDNWPVHRHPEVLATAARLGIELLWLPTYAPWLNPIEKLWRKLKQTLLHHHRMAEHWEEMKEQVARFLDQYADGSAALLRYVGLRPEDGPVRRPHRHRLPTARFSY